MAIGPLIVILLRLIVPLSILKRPLLGGIISMLLDGLDVVLITLIGQGDFTNYHFLDKWLDMYYLSLELWVSLDWRYNLARYTSFGLFVFRVIGFVAFELSHSRMYLFLFPNLFENFFLFYLIYTKFKKPETLTSGRLVVWLFILLIPKMVQEFILHFLQLQPWNWMKANVFKV